MCWLNLNKVSITSNIWKLNGPLIMPQYLGIVTDIIVHTN